MFIRLVPAAALLLAPQAFPQSASPTPHQPLYQVTIVSRTTKAINYGYLSAPTRIGFQGTPVATGASGDAVVEPKRGATLLKMRFENVPAPSRFGPQYLTYVAWAISPEGRAQNLGEVILDGSDKGKLTTSTPLQTFAIIVTAEPYYSVSQPSEVVVLENVVTRDTIGKVEEVNATYELLPRKPYTYDISAKPATSGAEPVSQGQYEAITALYQALNAIQIAQSQGADRYAPAQMTRARDLYNKARTFPTHLSKEIVSMAREATQIAEDGRTIAANRAAAEKRAAATAAESEVTPERAATPLPPPSPAAPPFEAQRSRAAAVSTEATPKQPAIEVDHGQFMRDDPQAAANRRQLMAALPRTLNVLDSSRGLIITVPAAATSTAQSYFSAVASAIRPFKDLHIEVEAHSADPGSEALTEREAELFRDGLIRAGVAPQIIVTRGYGNSRPRTSNATAAGRAENARVEIVISGDAIGILPSWDRTYRLDPPQMRR